MYIAVQTLLCVLAYVMLVMCDDCVGMQLLDLVNVLSLSTPRLGAHIRMVFEA